ncbi:hypothetical protein [Methanobacterium sp. ACI-7]|uniref:hypothetical protein n=1 Tax=unclassified Methanobacterium TaxID=2627676 RepID=UPI0039C11905
MSFNPFYSLLNSINLFLRRNVHFPKEKIGKNIIMEDGQEFTIFREAVIDKKSHSPAVFKVRFLLSGMTPENNIRFSWLPVPFFIGLPGFEAKVWTLNYKNNYFQGIYQWKNEEYAKKYSKSFAYRFMGRRAVPGTVSFKIIPNITLEKYLESLK